MKIWIGMFAAVLMLAGAGCATSVVETYPASPGQVSAGGDAIAANLKASNWGMYMFYFIPIWSGNPNRPNQYAYHVFQDNIQEKNLDRMLQARAQKSKWRIADVEISESASGFFSLWILWRRSHTARAVATER